MKQKTRKHNVLMSSFSNLPFSFMSFKQGFSKNILNLTHFIFVFLEKPEVKHLSFNPDVFTICLFQWHRNTPSLLHYVFWFNHTAFQNSLHYNELWLWIYTPHHHHLQLLMNNFTSKHTHFPNS